MPLDVWHSVLPDVLASRIDRASLQGDRCFRSHPLPSPSGPTSPIAVIRERVIGREDLRRAGERRVPPMAATAMDTFYEATRGTTS